MKKIFFLLIIVVLSTKSFAQVNISFRMPNASMVTKEQLMNLILTSTDPLDNVLVVGTLQARNTGEPLLVINASILTLKRGVNIITNADLVSMQYDFLNASMLTDFLQIGKYTYCVELKRNTPKGLVTVGKDCFVFGIEPVAPLLLQLPENKAVLKTSKPMLTWTPPQPVFLLSNIKYELNIVELKDGQKPLEAINDNSSIQYEPMLSANYATFSSAINSLENNKTYAWRVKAYTDQQFEMYSETWTFTYQNDSSTNNISRIPFVETTKDGGKLSVLQDGIIRCTYNNMIGDKEAALLIVDLNTAATTTIYKQMIAIQEGQNYITHKIKGIEKLEEKKVYLIKIVNSRGEVWSYIVQPKY